MLFDELRIRRHLLQQERDRRVEFGVLVAFAFSFAFRHGGLVAAGWWRGGGFEPAFERYGGWEDEFGEGDVFGPAGEEFREEFLDLGAEAVLVGSGAEVGFWGAQGGGEVEGWEG